jgi:hypothetical protein
MSASVAPLVGPGLVTRRLRVASAEVLLVKGLVEAWEGVASVFGEQGGDLTIAAPIDREAELDELMSAAEEMLADTRREGLSQDRRPSR